MSAGGWGESANFVEAYENLCQKMGVPLAENCPNKEKAFGPSKNGVVLVNWFDSEN